MKEDKASIINRKRREEISKNRINEAGKEASRIVRKFATFLSETDRDILEENIFNALLKTNDKG